MNGSWIGGSAARELAVRAELDKQLLPWAEADAVVDLARLELIQCTCKADVAAIEAEHASEQGAVGGNRHPPRAYVDLAARR